MNIGVGLIGARRRPDGYGLGQFMAREFLNYPLSRLVAIMGTTPQTLQQAITDLNKRDDLSNKFDGTVYTIEEEENFFNNPYIDLVAICSPSDTHEHYIKQGLKYSKHILVEKPFLNTNPAILFEQNIKKADKLVKLANSKDLLLSTNCQRVANIPILCEEYNLPKNPYSIEIELNVGTKSEKLESTRNLFELLITHPLSLLVKYGMTDIKSLDITNYSHNMSSDLSFLVIEGTYDSGERNFTYRIKLQQSRDVHFANMKVNIDNKGPVLINSEYAPNGEIRTIYEKTGEGIIRYSTDNLQTAVTSIVDAVYYRDKSHLPLITNNESFLIYTLQLKLKMIYLSGDYG
ncbi:hypothetical protein BEH94_06800 [Candidatus Altiarchaeales archaeon WOR_SM1_SCG]|nr:hypothetical protein BEH94_06800 [Candidatus Altiarchaeales archaeon WOR_SM1_SCG]